jgi:hypothetical protein
LSILKITRVNKHGSQSIICRRIALVQFYCLIALLFRKLILAASEMNHTKQLPGIAIGSIETQRLARGEFRLSETVLGEFSPTSGNGIVMRSPLRHECSGIARIEGNRPLEVFARLEVGGGLSARQVLSSAEHVVVGFQFVGRLRGGPVPLEAADLDGQCARNVLDDVVLYSKNVGNLPVVAIRPQVDAADCIAQLHRHANTFADLANAAFDQVARPKLATELLRARVLSFELKD